jgi:protein ImuB
VFACFHIPDFAVQAALLPEMLGATPEARAGLRASPLAILDGPASLPRVFATNHAARRAGIQPGMTKLQVETYGGVQLRKRSLAEEESAQGALISFAGAFSPRVESTCPGAVILDLAGTEKLLGPWPNAVREMSGRASEIGFDLRVAVTANPDTAFLAARSFSANSFSRAPRPDRSLQQASFACWRGNSAWAGIFIAAGEEADLLAPLSVDVLPISPEMLETLRSWGIRTFQTLAALPSLAITERLGREGLHLQKLARGEVVRPLLTVEQTAEFIASFEFDDPVETLESILFILNRLLQELCLKLLNTAMAAQELLLTIDLEVRQLQCHNKGKEKGREKDKEGDHYRHEWKLPVPTQDRNLLFDLVRLQLEKTTFSAPVRRLRLEVVPVKPRVAQENFFAPPSPEAEKLEITLERLRGIVGSADAAGIPCVGSPDLVDTHKPGSFTVRHFFSAYNTQPTRHPERSGVSEARFAESKDLYPFQKLQESTPVIALRIFRPALETSVELDGARPHFVRLWSRHRRVLAASGPWSSSGDWWNASVWWREEWDVALNTPAGPGFYRIYKDRIRERWFVEGVFD